RRRIGARARPPTRAVPAPPPPTRQSAAGRLANPGWPPSAVAASLAAESGSRASALGRNSMPADRLATASAAAGLQSQAAGLQVHQVRQVTRYQRIEVSAEPAPSSRPPPRLALAPPPTPAATTP